MKVISLMYHDIVEPGGEDASGFPGRDAALYKIERALFERHLDALGEAAAGAVTTVFDLAGANTTPPPRTPAKATSAPASTSSPASSPAATPVLITFDDGGASACAAAAMLERVGWRGHFFVTAGRVGSPGFLAREQIKELHARGHVVGSHSYSHPVRMARCARAELLDEWARSVALLSEITGERVRTASVPGGYYSDEVARAADSAGLEFLFTSEPTARVRRVGSCAVLGRYSLQRGATAGTVAAIAAGRIAPRLRQVVLWNAKKLAKAAGGEYYLRARRALVGGR
jgi:peptidoglycan/xylan/chitin deacetylase (PgdA/CDA1 family)